MITHIEKPILVAELSRIFASNTMMKSEQNLVHSIIQEINQNKNGIELDPHHRTALIGILEKHMDCDNVH